MRELLLATLTSIMTALLVIGILQLNLLPTSTPVGSKEVVTVMPASVIPTDHNPVIITELRHTRSVSVAEKLFNQERGKDITINPHDWLALTVTIYCEARGESWYGMAAVADTIRNRVASPMFPDTYYGVVTQRAQFSCIQDKLDIANNARIINYPEDEAKFRSIVGLAKRTIDGDLKRMTYNALFYHTTKVHPYWRKDYEKLGVIGNHVFYTTNRL